MHTLVNIYLIKIWHNFIPGCTVCIRIKIAHLVLTMKQNKVKQKKSSFMFKPPSSYQYIAFRCVYVFYDFNISYIYIVPT